MGLYALARTRNVTIRSRGQDTSPPWEVNLTPDHFVGKLAAPVELLDDPGMLTGTTVTFDDTTAVHYLDEALKKAARHYPLPVFLNNAPMEQVDFLKDAIHIHEWEGIRIGVYANRYHSRGMNFHGIVVDKPTMPEVNAIETTWITQADITDCPHLELTLPARKEAVQTPFLDELRHECRRAVYTAISIHNQPVDISPAQQHEAAQMGIHIPSAMPKLIPWAPGKADYTADKNTQREYVKNDTILMAIDLEPADEQALARALERKGILTTFAKTDGRLAGYAWYDRLPQATDLTITITLEGETFDLNEHRRTRRSLDNTKKADSITFSLTIVDPNDDETLIEVPGDLAFEKDQFNYGDDQKPIMTKDTDMSVGELQDMMFDAYFSPNYDGAADSYKTQKHDHMTGFKTTSLMYLSSMEDALKTILINALDNVRYQIPPGTTATITLNAQEVLKVSLDEGNTIDQDYA